MKRLLLIGFAACTFVLAPTLSASAMPGANPNAITDTDSSIVPVKGGHGHEWVASRRSRSSLRMGSRSGTSLRLATPSLLILSSKRQP
jgi:hypothetical protein